MQPSAPRIKDVPHCHLSLLLLPAVASDVTIWTSQLRWAMGGRLPIKKHKYDFQSLPEPLMELAGPAICLHTLQPCAQAGHCNSHTASTKLHLVGCFWLIQGSLLLQVMS